MCAQHTIETGKARKSYTKIRRKMMANMLYYTTKDGTVKTQLRTTKQVSFYLKDEDLDLLKQKANKAGMNKSEYIRNAIKGNYIQQKVIPEVNVELSKELKYIANNLNQIARILNTDPEVNADISKSLKTLRRTLKTIKGQANDQQNNTQKQYQSIS